ncbi:MAG: peptidoglycan DD-metalloendopeptidase family protein [Pseudomonadota bacterium]
MSVTSFFAAFRRLSARPSGRPITALAALAMILALPLAIWLSWPAGPPPPPAPLELDGAVQAPRAAGAQPAELAAIEAEAAPAATTRRLEIKRGDTLMKLLVKAGASRAEAHQAITALAEQYDPRKLKPGQTLSASFVPRLASGEARPRLSTLALRPDAERDLLVRRAPDGGFAARVVARPLNRELTVAEGTIDLSLFLAGQTAEVPVPVMIDLIRIFSFDVDFQRDIQKGDSFELLYERYSDLSGRPAKPGEVLFAALTLSGKRKELTRYLPKSGNPDYFDEKGRSVRKTLMRTPIDGARLSSGYGMRKHPILGYSRMHKGVDFAAPTGTPIYAAGDGVVERAGRNGGYGKYIRLRHNSSFKTAYAHLSGYAKGIKKGKRVRQGQVIGYVGSTGRSTGPHLHYEVIRGGKQVNPRKVKLPSGETLKGGDLEGFLAARAETQGLYDAAQAPTELACAEGDAAAETVPAEGC